MGKISKIIPKSIKEKMKILKWKIEYDKYSKLQKKNNEKEYIIFGIPVHGNIGDQAIAVAENKFLKDLGANHILEIISPKVIEAAQILKKIVSKDAIIIIHGGGFLGNQWAKEEERAECVISSFIENKVVIFPQTVFFKDNDEGKIAQEKAKRIFSQHKNLVICAREKKSYSIMKEIFQSAKIILIPDIVLYLDEFKGDFNREGILLCLRSDPEAKLKENERKIIYNLVSRYDNNITWTDTVIDEVIFEDKRKQCFYNKLNEFSKSKLIITDRLHGMIFAAMTKTPCIVMGNYNHKVKGVYEWIKDLQYIKYIDSIEEVENEVKKLYELKVEKYDCIDKRLFKQLAEELK